MVIRAQTKRVIKTSECHSLQTYVSKINSRTSIKKVWSMVRKIAGKSPATNIKHLNVNNTEITEIPDIAKSLGHSFSNNSSSNNYGTKFQGFRNWLKTSTSNLNPINWIRIITKSGMPSQNHKTVRFARMTSTTRSLNTFHRMLLTLYSKR